MRYRFEIKGESSQIFYMELTVEEAMAIGSFVDQANNTPADHNPTGVDLSVQIDMENVEREE